MASRSASSLSKPLTCRKGQGDVLPGGQVHEEVEALEHHGHLGADQVDVDVLPQDAVALEEDVPSVWLVQAVDAPQQGALAAARRADDGHDLAGHDLHRYALEDLVVAEALRQIDSFRSAGWPLLLSSHVARDAVLPFDHPHDVRGEGGQGEVEQSHEQVGGERIEVYPAMILVLNQVISMAPIA